MSEPLECPKESTLLILLPGMPTVGVFGTGK
jgi:hypothetical protein